MAFTDILGQDQAKHILIKALQSERVAHAYLFFGAESIGKKRTAEEFAKALNCTAPKGDDSCGTCTACRKIQQGLHPDLFLVEPQRSSPSARDTVIKIDEIRKLQGKLGYLPYEGKTKVVIIDGAEKMNLQACNAFLKTLEEPPQATVLILITSNIQKMLPTILSRCQGVRFQPLSVSELRTVLNREQELEIDPEELELRLVRSQGQVARALEEDLLEAASYRAELLALIDGIAFDRVDLLFEWCKRVSRDSARVGIILQEMMGLLRDLAFIRSGGARELLLNRDIADQLIPLAGKQSATGWTGWMDSVQKTQNALTGNANIQLSLENLLMDFCDAA